ncbi:hypothetical protein EDB80DRAFT_681051 [Ilyonectria destructans]|nr:hypothetical protein EDB80DRAFT_681051 [Ilyonectria destructans]
MAGGIPRQRLTFDDENDKPDGVSFELRFRDWKLGAFKPKPLPKPKTKGKAAKKKEAVEVGEPVDLDLERVKSFIGCAIMEELGVRDLMYSEGQDESNQKITLSHNYTYQLIPADQKLRTTDLYTSLIKMFAERGYEVQKGIPKLPGTTGGSVMSLDLSAPEEIAAPMTASVLAPAPVKAPSIAKSIKPVEAVIEPARSVVGSVKSASREEIGKLSSLMEGVKTIKTLLKVLPILPPVKSDRAMLARIFSG